MTERLLQFIWQFQYFNKGELQTTAGETLQIIFPGSLNTNQGPDFLDAKIKINKTTWAGNIELHVNETDWKKHNHHTDKNYKNVVLHVVWINDPVATGMAESSLPVLQLNDRVAKTLLLRYEELMNARGFIPCENTITTVKPLVLQNWKERLLVERLMRKAEIANRFLAQTNHHWEESFWWLLARNFGIKINADAFEAIARSISINILAKHKNQIHQLEALLMGQAGLLEKDFAEEYPRLLKKEYLFLKKKYGLKAINLPVHFLRMRPGNFPTIRLAQLAILIHNSNHLFSRIIETSSLKDLLHWLDSTANDYWHYHYLFDEPGNFKKKKLGKAMAETIVINTICPMLFAYGHFHNEQKHKDKALQWLDETKAEKNTITEKFQQLGLQNKNARDSQALIELKNEYCSKKRCLDCAIGNALLKS